MSAPKQQNQPKIILASKSPRRRYLLKQAGLDFTVIPAEFDESSVTVWPVEAYVQVLAEEKAKVIAEKYPESWVIGADTIVAVDERILGKPASLTEARAMLSALSGRVHLVLTGYSIRHEATGFKFSDTVATKVTFKALSEPEIEWYIRTDEPFDKAGAYAIQGLGTFLVRRIEGSYTNVVGLPVCEVIEQLTRLGVIHFSHSEELSERIGT